MRRYRRFDLAEVRAHESLRLARELGDFSDLKKRALDRQATDDELEFVFDIVERWRPDGRALRRAKNRERDAAIRRAAWVLEFLAQDEQHIIACAKEIHGRQWKRYAAPLLMGKDRKRVVRWVMDNHGLKQARAQALVPKRAPRSRHR